MAIGAACAALSLGYVQIAAAQVVTMPGFYAGLDLGGGFGTARKNFSVGTSTGNFAMSGPVGGAELGADWTLGNIVLGVQGRISGSGVQGATHAPGPLYTYVSGNHWLATVDPLLGYQIAPGIVPYAIGGLALGDVEVKTTRTKTGVDAVNYDSVQPGWNAGVGVRLSLTPRWVADVQYQYVRLAAAELPGDLGQPTQSSFQENLFTAGVFYRF